MLYLYRFNRIGYIVSPTEENKHKELIKKNKVEVKFIARLGGGKGRFPSPKKVPSSKLTLLYDFDTIKALAEE